MKAEGRSSRSQLLFDTGFLDSFPWPEETAWAKTSTLSERAAPQGQRWKEHEEHSVLFTRLGERRTRSCAVGATWTQASSEWPASGSSEWSPSHWPLGRWSRDPGSRHGRLLWSPPLLPSGRVPADTWHGWSVGITVFYTRTIPPLKELYQLMWKKVLVQNVLTCRTLDGTEKIMASLKMGLVSSLLVDVFFLLIFLPSCRRYTLTKGSGRKRELPKRYQNEHILHTQGKKTQSKFQSCKHSMIGHFS